MPVHDWSRVDAGLFHHFHQHWVVTLADALNAGTLPTDHFALTERPAPHPAHGETDLYARRASRLTVRHRHGRVVAVIEVVSPGNKATQSEFRAFVEKVTDLVRQGVHVLVIDLFGPTPRDPRGLAQALWEQFAGEDLPLPPDKPLTLAAFDAGPPPVAYIEPAAVGDPLPDMPVFLRPETYVPAPLEATYQATWATFPAALKGLLDPPRP